MSNHYDFYREPNDPSDEEIEEFVKLFQEAVKDVPFYAIKIETFRASGIGFGKSRKLKH